MPAEYQAFIPQKQEPLVHPNGVPSFGVVLSAAMEGHNVRSNQLLPKDLRRKRPFSSDLITGLEEQGYPYSMSPGSFSELKSSQSLSGHPILLIAALFRALDLNTGEMELLFLSYSLDYLVRRVDGRYYRSHRLTESEVARQEFIGDVARMRAGERLKECEEEGFRRALIVLKTTVYTKEDADE